MKSDYVSIEKRDGVAIVRFDRKANLNAFNEKLVVELTQAARSFFDDLETHAGGPRRSTQCVLRRLRFESQGQLAERDRRSKRRYRAYGGVRLCKAWESMPQITIAAIEKLAVGAGVAIALACDWRVLARDAYLYVPEVKIGLNLQWGALPRLITPRRAGPRQAHHDHVRENARRSGARVGGWSTNSPMLGRRWRRRWRWRKSFCRCRSRPCE